MMDTSRTLIQELCGDIELDQYLQKLYNKLLKRYSRLLFKRTAILNDTQINEKEKNDLLRYANILSLSNGLKESGEHKVWSQQIVALLSLLFPQDLNIKKVKDTVLLNCTNYYGLKKSPLEISNFDFIETVFQNTKYEYLEMPSFNDKHFYESQKEIYDGINSPAISYSAPTSMGKSFLMRIFMISKIKEGFIGNLALIVPTKALINELDRKVIADLEPFVKTKDYRVVKTPNDMVLESNHNFVFVMTPERFFHLLVMKPEININYLFIDEAHKLSKNEGRTAFYYKIFSILRYRNTVPHFIFASPNIPNPNAYLKLINNDGKDYASNYSPVSQIKYIINLKTGKYYSYNDYSKETIQIGNAVKNDTFIDIIDKIGNQSIDNGKAKVKNLIYCKSVYKAINYAKEYADKCKDLNDPILDKLSKDIAKQVHSDYFLVGLIKKGIAYHVGYIPSNLRQRIEEQFIHGNLRFLFCTSTLIECVNLPADNLFITSNKNGPEKFDKISFQNLMGRVGRIDYNLFGNLFLVVTENEKTKLEKTYLDLLKQNAEEQYLSIDNIEDDTVQLINKSILNSDYSFQSLSPKNEELESYRKLSLVLLDDLKKNIQSPIVDKFLSNDDNTKNQMINKARQLPNIESLDITEDQVQSLEYYLSNFNLTYPISTDHNSVYDFLQILSKLFNWPTYEKDDLGRGNSIKHYSYIIFGWMEGKGLNQIIESSINSIAWNGQVFNRHTHKYDTYNSNDKMQKNLIIADTLYELENIVIFKISNYFREFTEKLKKVNPTALINDWYEYVEYGTKDSLIIQLEKIGYTRETASYIKAKKDKLLNFSKPNSLCNFSLVSSQIKNTDNGDLMRETKKIKGNLPELFE